MESSYVLEVNKLCKNIGRKKLIDDVSFKLKKGDILGLVGPNGAGKTTLMKLLVNLMIKSSGDVNYDGDYLENVGAIIEEASVYMYLTGYENLYLHNMFYHNSYEEVNKIVLLVGLSNVINNKVSTYSLGMRQRLGIAISLLSKPRLLILDEPLNGLDPIGINEIRDLIIKLASDGCTIIISSHILSELEMICNRYLFINKGRIIKDIDSCKLLEFSDSVIFSLSSVNIDSIIYSYDIIDDHRVRIKVSNGNVSNIIKTLLLNNIDVYEVYNERKSLDDIFREFLND